MRTTVIIALLICTQIAWAENSAFLGFRTHDLKSFGFTARVCEDGTACANFGAHDGALLGSLTANVTTDDDHTEDVWARAELGVGYLHANGDGGFVGVGAGGVGGGMPDGGIEVNYTAAFNLKGLAMASWDVGLTVREQAQVETLPASTDTVTAPTVTEPPEPPISKPPKKPKKPKKTRMCKKGKKR